MQQSECCVTTCGNECEVRRGGPSEGAVDTILRRGSRGLASSAALPCPNSEHFRVLSDRPINGARIGSFVYIAPIVSTGGNGQIGQTFKEGSAKSHLEPLPILIPTYGPRHTAHDAAVRRTASFYHSCRNKQSTGSLCSAARHDCCCGRRRSWGPRPPDCECVIRKRKA